MNILKRIKNLWKLSEYRFVNDPTQPPKLVKNVVTIQKKLATIIPNKEVDLLTEEIKDDNPDK